ncbi:hypothetical protein GC173_03565 [bacterium]|nr:hypothetical protein [bacterium]
MQTPVFHRLGTAYHLEINSADVLARIHELDPARWAVTSLPVRELQCDPSLAKVLDPSGKGRILVNQLVEGRDWAFKRIARRDAFCEKSATLKLADLDPQDADAALLKRAAERLISETKATDGSSVSLTQVRAYRAVFVQAPANGDGIVPPEAVTDPDAAQIVRDIVATTGGAKDLSGRDGVGESHIGAFVTGMEAWLAWKKKGDDSSLFPWSSETAGGAAVVAAVEKKIDQYFAQCELVRAEPAAVKRFALTDADLAAIAVDDPAAIAARLGELTIATPRADGVLDFNGTLNPAWETRLNDLRTKVLAVAFPGFEGTLTVERWRAARAIFQPWRDWQAAKPTQPWEKLDAAKLNVDVLNPSFEKIRAAIALDSAAAPELAKIDDLEKLIILQRWLVELTNNFVSLIALFDPNKRTMFEVGSLVIDGRRLEFCMKVTDRAGHRKVASESRAYLVYAQTFEKDGGPVLFEVAAPVTRGEKGRLIVGKRGIFVCTDGKILDAQIVEVVENPISVWEAMKSPFLRVAAFINKKIEDFAASKAASAEKNLVDKVDKPVVPPPAPAPAAQKRDVGMMVGMLAGGGLAFAAIGSALAYMAKALADIDVMSLVLALVSIIVVIAAFAGFLGWLKLRLRDVGPLLEANGWAINPRMRMSGLLARSFNRYPPLPSDSRKEIVAKFAEPTDDSEEAEGEEKESRTRIILVVILVVLALYLITNWGTL